MNKRLQTTNRGNHVDLAKWSNEEWTAEFGVCDEPTHFSYVSIVDA